MAEHWFITLCFFVVAIGTRKDVAAYAFMAALVSSIAVDAQSLAAEYVLVIIAASNCGLAVFSSYHFLAYKNKLALVASVLSSIAVINNMCQVLFYSHAGIVISEVVAWAMLIALVVLPGRQGWLFDVFPIDRRHSSDGVLRDSSHSRREGDN